MSSLILPLLSLLLSVQIASAAPTCDDVINASLDPAVTPVSPYTVKVLERAKGALAALPSTASTDFLSILPGWTRMVSSFFAMLVDTKLRILEQERNLREQTACLRFDLLLLECAMEQLRIQLHQAFQGDSVVRIALLTDLISFLHERYISVVEGARDPTFEDPMWGKIMAFDPPESDAWCCPLAFSPAPCEQKPSDECPGIAFRTLNACVIGGCTAPDGSDPFADDEGMCPFTSDYLPPGTSGYGCGKAVLVPLASGVSSYIALKKESDAITKVTDELKAYRDEAALFFGVQAEIDALLGKPSSGGTPPDNKYRFYEGCLRFKMVCSNDNTVDCTSDEDCTAGDPLAVCMNLGIEGTCTDNPSQECIEDAECAAFGDGKGGCMNLRGATFWELRGPFSIERNEGTVTNAFRKLRKIQGENREHIDEFKFAEEFGPDEQGMADQRKNAHPFETFIRQAVRAVFKQWNALQGEKEANLFAIGSDPELRVAKQLQPLRSAGSRLATLANKPDGLRRFLVTFAYYMRRSCMYRPCNKLLEKVLRIAFTDTCFPYTEGEYLTDSCGSPRAEKCIKDAKLDSEMGFVFTPWDCS